MQGLGITCPKGETQGICEEGMVSSWERWETGERTPEGEPQVSASPRGGGGQTSVQGFLCHNPKNPNPGMICVLIPRLCPVIPFPTAGKPFRLGFLTEPTAFLGNSFSSAPPREPNSPSKSGLGRR